MTREDININGVRELLRPDEGFQEAWVGSEKSKGSNFLRYTQSEFPGGPVMGSACQSGGHRFDP